MSGRSRRRGGGERKFLRPPSRLSTEGSSAMRSIEQPEVIDQQRRRFFGAAALAATAAQLGWIGSAAAKPTQLSAIRPGSNATFPPLKQIDAGLLNVGYAELGPAGGPAVILLNGWPYDIYSYVDVAPVLAAAGYRVIV